MVLADDDFATIVEAVRQGRVVFDNLRKSILFLLSCNISEVAIVFSAALLFAAPALLPLQLLWINLVTDGLPALALGVDPGSARVMERKPRGPEESILTPARRLDVVVQGLLITGGALIMFVGVTLGWIATDGPAHAQTMLFTTIVLTQLLHAFNFRSDTRSVFRLESLRNVWLVAAFVGSMALQCVVIYAEPAQHVFSTRPLGLRDWIAVLLASIVPLVIIDILKVLRARTSRTR
jgi:Ca2+-transporting ATPase